MPPPHHLSAAAALLALWANAALAQPVYKCTDAAGATSYSNVPCTLDATEERVRVAPDPAPHVALGLPKEASNIAKLTAAAAVLESIAIDGRSCDWALKVTKRLNECDAFITKIKHPRFKYARTTIQALLQDAEFGQAHTTQLRAQVRLMEEILGHMKLAGERL